MSASKKFMHPAALAAWEATCKAANLRPVIVQTLGNAPKSKGFHAADGKYKNPKGEWVEYCAAIDVSVRQLATRLSDGATVEMNESRIHWFLSKLAENGFAGWYRRESQGFDDKHLHAVFAGVKMKAGLRRQVTDFLNDRTGLASHGPESFYTAPPEVDAKIRALFEGAN